jgi:hypothetical protein
MIENVILTIIANWVDSERTKARGLLSVHVLPTLAAL